MDLWHVSCLPPPRLFPHLSYLNYFKVTRWRISMWWKWAHSSRPNRACFSAARWPQTSQHTLTTSEPKCSRQAEEHQPGTERPLTGRWKSLACMEQSRCCLFQPPGCLLGAAGWEVKLLLLLSHGPWWQQFDDHVWNSWFLVTSVTYYGSTHLKNPKPPHHPPVLSPVTHTVPPQPPSSPFF